MPVTGAFMVVHGMAGMGGRLGGHQPGTEKMLHYDLNKSLRCLHGFIALWYISKRMLLKLYVSSCWRRWRYNLVVQKYIGLMVRAAADGTEITYRGYKLGLYPFPSTATAAIVSSSPLAIKGV